MKIHGPELPPEQQVINQKKPLRSTGQQRSENIGNDNTAARKAALFIEKGLDIPPSQLRMLDAELSVLGMKLSELDIESALRALILYRYNIPLDPLLVNHNWDKETSAFEKLAVLIEHARALLADNRFTGEMRITVETLIDTVNTLFTHREDNVSVKFLLENILETWVYELETHLIGLFDGNPEIVTTITGEIQAGIETALSEHLSDHPLGRFIEELRSAVSNFQESFLGLPMEKAGMEELIREALSTLRARLSILAVKYDMFLASDTIGGLSAGILAGFFDSRVRELEQRLISGFSDSTTEALFTGFAGNSESAPGLKEMLHKSGMAFEWRLLAWYRSGQDPARFHALMYEDLKGIMLNFINRLRDRKGKRNIHEKLGSLEKEAQSVINTITRRQIATILDGYQGKGRLYLEVPFGNNPGHEQARIWAHGRKKPEKNTLDPGNLSLSFTVETSRLGAVNVFMPFTGKTVSLRFVFENERYRALAEEMGVEMKKSLMMRGFTVQEMTFWIQSDETGSSKKSDVKKQTGSVNITG